MALVRTMSDPARLKVEFLLYETCRHDRFKEMKNGVG